MSADVGTPSGTAAAVATAVVALRDVRIEFPRPGDAPLVITQRLSLDVPSGRMHVLAGRSGSGKTSILRVAAGLARPSAGDVTWRGDSLDGLSDDEVTAKRRGLIGYLDQAGALLPGLTAVENVLLPAVPQRRARRLSRKALDLLTQVGVEQRATHFPDQLSGGERQRVALARALLLGPAALLADEPTAGLDRTSADGVITLLRRLASVGVAVLVASHDPHLVGAGDHVLSLD